MNKIEKLLRRLSGKEKGRLLKLLNQIAGKEWRHLDLKQLKGMKNVYRVRQGKLRVIFFEDKKNIKILAVEKRKETTYKKY